MAQRFNWWAAHFRPARTSDGWRTPVQGDGKGFPDLVLARSEVYGDGRVIYVELKSEKGRLTQDQEMWLQQLREAGQEVYLWRPSDVDEAIEVLRE